MFNDLLWVPGGTCGDGRDADAAPREPCGSVELGGYCATYLHPARRASLARRPPTHVLSTSALTAAGSCAW